ncbi:ATP-dependent DNA helicase PIF1 [Ceratobasidium sp. AG-Ba]|nr:ATP-dependent DNA helicase PIF1 [Ceratobasidium sp. AG-Ba]QRW15005.1 ATP-dependent DNA helicase PIF1 [Ceratobasidium sp. AG-Ba]
MDIEKGGKLIRSIRTARRLQFPITPAYSFTDYRSQGQTIESVIFDITNPPTGGSLSLYNIYMALSRSSGTSAVRIMCDFDAALLMKPLNSCLAEEEACLEALDASTFTWYN